RAPPRNGRRSPGRAGSGPGGLPAVAVGRLDGHLDVVRVTLTQAGRGDTHQLTTLPQRCHGPGACVPHGLVKPSDKLVGHCRERSTERYLTLDALGNELVLGSDLGLGVTVLGEGAATHRTERTHTTVGLELLAVDEDQFAGAFLHSGEKTTEHDGTVPGDHVLGDRTLVLQTTVGDERLLRRPTGLGRLENGGDLGGTDPGDHTRGADGTGTDPDLDRIRPGVDEQLGAVPGGDVARDHVG